jgi:hypothetical protein
MAARTIAALKANWHGTDPYDQAVDTYDTMNAPQDTIAAATITTLTSTTGNITSVNSTTVKATTLTANTGPLDFSSVIKPNAAAGADAAGALLLGVGTSASPATTAVADKMFIELRTQSTATTGDSRGIYVRHELKGAGGSGESLRGNTNVTAAAANAHGAHDSVAFQTGGSITGQCAGHRAGLIIPDRAMAANGTYYGAMAEIVIEGNSSDISPVTKHAVLEVSVNGAGNAAAKDKVLYMMSFDHGGTDATGKTIYSHDHDPGNAAGSIRVMVNGVARFLKFWAAE